MNALIVQRLVGRLKAPTLRMQTTKTGKIHYWKDGRVAYAVIRNTQMRPLFYCSDGFHLDGAELDGLEVLPNSPVKNEQKIRLRDPADADRVVKLVLKSL